MRTLRTQLLSLAALPVLTSVLASASFANGVINVEIDYMVGAAHDHMPTTEELDAVIQMFACQGWILNVVVDDAIPEVSILQCPDIENDPFFSCDGPLSYKNIKDTWFDNTDGTWHYCLFGHQYDAGNGPGSSGIADAADDFIVTLWNFSELPNGSPFDVAGTFAHELGHNLGLGHANPTSGADGAGPYSPNYASLMSYQYQLRGVRTGLECLDIIDDTSIFKDLDYSHGRLPSLAEDALDEEVGVGIRPIDFDCDGFAEPNLVEQELTDESPWCGEVGKSELVSDYDDWANIIDIPTCGAPDSYDVSRTWTCITRSESEALLEQQWSFMGPDGGSACTFGATLALEPCIPSDDMHWVDPMALFEGEGTGSQPHKSLTDALFSTPDGVVLYLQEGLHITSPGNLIIDRPLILAGPGGAIIDP